MASRPEYNPYVAVKDGLSGLTGEPVRNQLKIELTERCNNNCIHCCINLPAKDEKAMREELSTQEGIDILCAAASLNYLTVRFTGGEPLLRGDFSDLYLAARRLGLKVLIFTNATLITPEIADMFARVPPRELIEITLYGLTRESYEGVSRSPGSFEAAWRGMQLLLERDVPFVVKGVILPSNRHEIDEFVSWSKSIPWMDRDPRFAFDFDLRDRRDDEQRNAVIRGLRTAWDDGLRLLHRYTEEDRSERQLLAAKLMCFPSDDKLFICLPQGCVDSRGFFNPCISLKCPSIAYDLRKGSLGEATTTFLESIRDLRACNPDYLKRCARCFLRGFCEQCPARSWLETGALDVPSEYHCKVAHDKAEYYGFLKPNERAWEVVDWESRIRSVLLR